MADKKLPVKDVLAAIDMGAKSAWNELTEDEKKGISFWLMNRYASSVTGSREKQELAVLKTNEYFNKHYMTTSKHPQLQWQLLCMSSNTGNIEYHKWLGLKSSVTNISKKNVKLLAQIYPLMKLDEIEMLAKDISEKEIKDLAMDYDINVN